MILLHAFVLVIYRIAARPNSELRQKVLDLVSVLVLTKSLIYKTAEPEMT